MNDYPLIDIHTHHKESKTGIVSLYSMRLGIENIEYGVCEACGDNERVYNNHEISHDGVRKPFCAGIHPWDCTAVPIEVVSRLETMDIAAVGEIGLDTLRGGDISRQTQYFDAQLKIALRHRIPVIIHTVRASQQTVTAIRKSGMDGTKVIIHGFSGGEKNYLLFRNEGYTVSFGLRSLLSPACREVIKAANDGAFLLETDADDKCGDNPNTIESVYEQVAELRGCDTERLRRVVYETYERIFEK